MPSIGEQKELDPIPQFKAQGHGEPYLERVLGS
jgi:hypothetical protein